MENVEKSYGQERLSNSPLSKILAEFHRCEQSKLMETIQEFHNEMEKAEEKSFSRTIDQTDPMKFESAREFLDSLKKE